MAGPLFLVSSVVLSLCVLLCESAQPAPPSRESAVASRLQRLEQLKISMDALQGVGDAVERVDKEPQVRQVRDQRLAAVGESEFGDAGVRGGPQGDAAVGGAGSELGASRNGVQVRKPVSRNELVRDPPSVSGRSSNNLASNNIRSASSLSNAAGDKDVGEVPANGLRGNTRLVSPSAKRNRSSHSR